MGKSDGRNRLVRQFPQSRASLDTVLGWHASSGARGTLVIDDALVFERSWSPPEGSTGRDLVERTRRRIEAALETHRAAVYVVLYDKLAYMPLAKAVEQRRREAAQQKSAAKKAASAAAAADGAAPPPLIPLGVDDAELSLDGVLPQPFQSMLNERNVLRPRVLRFLTAALCGGFGGEMRLRLPADVCVVFDGHCASLPYLRDAAALQPEHDDAIIDGDDVTPLMLYHDSEDVDAYRFGYSAALRNELGEADFAAFWYAQRAAPWRIGLDGDDDDPAAMGARTVVVRTVDSDLAYLAMLYCERHRRYAREQRVYVEFEGRGSNATYFFDAAAACIALHEYEHPAGVMARPVHSLCIAMWAAGGDYTDGFRGLTHERFFDAWLHRGEDLLSAGDLNAAALVRLVQAACVERAPLMPAPAVPHCAWLQRAAADATAAKQCPDTALLRLRALQLRYLMHMSLQVGAAERRLEFLPLREHGYAAEGDDGDASVEITAQNIVRL
jgi:hypothetical protein